jgi:hypothetical protein
MISLQALNTVLTLPVSVAHVKWWYICPGEAWKGKMQNGRQTQRDKRSHKGRLTDSLPHNRINASRETSKQASKQASTFFSVSVYLDLNRFRM